MTLVRASTYELASPRSRSRSAASKVPSSSPDFRPPLRQRFTAALARITTDQDRAHLSLLPLIFSFYFILFLLSRCILFAAGIHSSYTSSLETSVDPVHGFPRVRTFRLTYLRVENIRMEKTGYYYARVSYERGRGKNVARKFRIRVLRCR